MNKHIIALMLYLALFGILFMVSLHNYIVKESFFDIGLPGQSMDLFILALSFVGVAKSLVHIVRH